MSRESQIKKLGSLLFIFGRSASRQDKFVEWALKKAHLLAREETR